MGVFVEDLKNKDNFLIVNWWNWRPIVELIRVSGLVDRERLELMEFSGGGPKITEEESQKLAQFFEENVLSKIIPGERMLNNFSITSEPDDGTFYRDNQSLNYSVTYEWLNKLTGFLKECKGFTVI
jgi:hypothetical protein